MKYAVSLFGWMALILVVFDNVWLPQGNVMFSPRQKTFCSTLRWGPPSPSTNQLSPPGWPAAVWRSGWPVLGMTTVSCVKLRKHWKFNVLGEVRREDVLEWPRKAWRQREGCTAGGNQRRGGGGEWLAFTPYIQCIILPQSTSVAKPWECVLGFFYLFFSNMPIIITGVES